jgi:hypothetical protein
MAIHGESGDQMMGICGLKNPSVKVKGIPGYPTMSILDEQK